MKAKFCPFDQSRSYDLYRKLRPIALLVGRVGDDASLVELPHTKANHAEGNDDRNKEDDDRSYHGKSKYLLRSCDARKCCKFCATSCKELLDSHVRIFDE